MDSHITCILVAILDFGNHFRFWWHIGPVYANQFLSSFLQIVVSAGHVDTRECDQIIKEYQRLLESSRIRDVIKFESFNKEWDICGSVSRWQRIDMCNTCMLFIIKNL